MRQRDPLSPEEQRELDALDRALAGDRVDADLREFEDLVNDIRATAPEMTPAFAASLEHRVSEGFPATDEHPAPRSPRRWVWFPAAGALCAGLAAIVVVLGANGTGHQEASTLARESAPATEQSVKSGSSGGSASGDAATDTAPPPAPQASAPAASSGTALAPAPAPARAKAGPAAIVAANGPRKVQRTADLVLRVPTGQIESTSDGVIRTVDRFGGIVANSTISSDDSTGGEATFQLRIPTERLDDALAALSKLGHVAQRTQDLTDITGSFTSAEDRLSDARAERRGLLKALGRATTQQQIDSLKARLRDVRGRIARLNGNLESLRRRADLSTVSVTVRGGGSESEPGTGGGSWSPGDAARDAVRVLEVIAGVLLITLAVVAPLGILALAGAFGVRATRRRRREAALDPA